MAGTDEAMGGILEILGRRINIGGGIGATTNLNQLYIWNSTMSNFVNNSAFNKIHFLKVSDKKICMLF